MPTGGSSMLRDLCGKRVLLLQGPNGPFFRRLAEDLRARGCTVSKVNFHAADDLFYRGPEVIRFRGELDEWPERLCTILTERRIEALVVFGDLRPIHQRAIRVAEGLGVAVWVLEEGYLRPDWVTFERDGVNGNSRLSKDPAFYRRVFAELPELPRAVPLGNTFWQQVGWTVLNACAMTFLWFRYPQYRHHRDVNAFRQAFYWVRGALRKLVYAVRERGVLARLVGEHAGKYFLVPLQVHCDAQLRHSPYRRFEDFIEDVVSSFAANAPKDTLLVVKHHPFDRPYRDYRGLLATLGTRLGCAERLVYVHDLHLPTLLRHCRGVVTMNSTAGLSALHHGAPVKALGTAVYDVPGLTSTASLAEFFVDPGQVDVELLAGFVRWLRETNQVNGSFYKRVRALGTVSGLDAAAFGPATEPARPAEGALEEPALRHPVA